MDAVQLEKIRQSFLLTPEEAIERNLYLKKVKDGLDEWNKKPNSNLRFQTPDEQIENDNYNEFVEVNNNA